MTAAVAAGSRARPPLSIYVTPLLALAVFINYVDRGNLATAGPLMKDEMGLSAQDFGLIVSAFFWSYTPGQLVSGWLSERINPYRTLGIGLAVWSLATAATGLASGFGMLIALRILVGAGESAAFPCKAKIFAQDMAQHRLGAANGLVVGVGTALGPAFGTLAGGFIMAAYGWRASFLVFGLVSLLWLIPWTAVSRGRPSTPRSPEEAEPSFLQIAARREAWGAGLGHFATNYSFYFVITWLPIYLVKARGYSITEMATTGAMIYVVYAASSLVLGWLADRLIAGGAQVGLVRKSWSVLSHTIAAAGLAACAVGDAQVSLISLYVVAFGFGFNASTIFAVGQTLAGPGAGGKWMGFQNGLGNIAGIVGPLITGALVDRTGSFSLAFVVAALAALTGIIGWVGMIPKVAPIAWDAQRGS